MAGVFRVGVIRILGNQNSSKLLSNRTDFVLPARAISGRSLREATTPVKKPSPWPYKTKRYNFFNSLYDKTTKRLDDNSKIIVVEGPPAAGKTDLAKALADEFDMLYLPEANQDMYYTNDYGYNYRKLDPQLPESVRSFDIPDFLANPRHCLAGTFQLRQYIVKYSQYIDALAHLLSTGQGVVLDRCVYSDFVFIEAMFNDGYISKEVRSIYYDARKCTITELLKPHLIVYLDLPVDKVMKNIKNRGYTCETKSNVLNTKYLSTIEDVYKLNYLKDISTNSELLIYDWSDKGDIEVVVEDIERITFSRRDDHDPKCIDWVHYNEEDWATLRNTYADKKDDLMRYLNIPRFDAPELISDAEDVHKFIQVMGEAPGNVYDPGYNVAMGDSVLFRTGIMRRPTLPLIERCLS
ncbi:hypothetical protein RN001_003841 [Aquatica leii]|uniref:NADH dehydrogenase [ubiquinone] 1 alpha subcomplex subunit 10, mitochondrial n=1 Tax=Aquatica leii TaxID=1421715 RepID=A0AAN7QBZ2_9COLE|nr:hypothetical protein RN001_003841 [Aquatica leii]